MPTKEYTEAVTNSGKLLLIQEISDWLYTQPEEVPKLSILTFLMEKAGEV